MRPSKQYFCYYLKDNILIFDVFDYIEELAADYVDYAFEWNIVKDGKVSSKNIRIKEYIQLWISDAQIIINDKSSKSNCKVLCFFREKTNLNVWSSYFEDPFTFIKIAKRVLKQKLPNFIEINTEIPLFQCVKGTFNDIPCIIPSGEDEEFLTKNKKRLRSAIDIENQFGKIGCHPF
jgi:hypothetical protein